MVLSRLLLLKNYSNYEQFCIYTNKNILFYLVCFVERDWKWVEERERDGKEEREMNK